MIKRSLPTNCLSVFDYFAGLALKGLNDQSSNWANVNAEIPKG